MAYWEEGVLLYLLFVHGCSAYTLKSITASSSEDPPEWAEVATSPDGMYKAKIGIVYQESTSVSWECQLNVVKVDYENPQTSYSCPMAVTQDSCTLAVSEQGSVLLSTNQTSKIISQINGYQVAYSQYLVFQLDNQGIMHFSYSTNLPPPSSSASHSHFGSDVTPNLRILEDSPWSDIPPPSSSGSQSHSGSGVTPNLSLRFIGIVIGAVFGVVVLLFAVYKCYKHCHIGCGCEGSFEEEKKKKEAEAKAKEEKEKKEREERGRNCCSCRNSSYGYCSTYCRYYDYC